MAEKLKRGFALMSPERRKQIASEGGKAAQAEGTAHRFTSEEARAAGKKGGEAVSVDLAYMAKIGKLGGTTRGRNRKLRMEQEREAGLPANPSPDPAESL